MIMHRRSMQVALIAALAATIVCSLQTAVAQQITQEEILRGIVERVEPLSHPLGNTLQPIRGSRLAGWLPEDDAEAREFLLALNDRGVSLFANWRVGSDSARDFALRLGRLQQELGLPVSVHATSAMTGFYDGDESTLHVAEDGSTFAWALHGSRKMGCPFRLEQRAEVIRGQWQELADAYADAGLRLDWVSMDWYSDGPVEWNESWDASRRCTVCRENIPGIDDFRTFQETLRRIRGELQRECAVDVVQARFPDVLIGNWAVAPNDGWRYWYDYYETLPEGAPYRQEQLALYRTWADEFSHTGYTYANPTCYPWDDMYAWYPDYPTDYRWFFMLMKAGTNAARHTPIETPMVVWVKWRPTPVRGEAEPAPAMSLETYREFLAHMLLRGSDGFMMWCRAEETVDEVAAIAPVLDEAMRYREFIEEGEPVLFDLPRRPTTVVSALRLGDRLLVRRTDFADRPFPVTRIVDGQRVTIPHAPGRFMLIDMPGNGE
jgi:hypothetical protein